MQAAAVLFSFFHYQRRKEVLWDCLPLVLRSLGLPLKGELPFVSSPECLEPVLVDLMTCLTPRQGYSCSSSAWHLGLPFTDQMFVCLCYILIASKNQTPPLGTSFLEKSFSYCFLPNMYWLKALICTKVNPPQCMIAKWFLKNLKMGEGEWEGFLGT